jgi:hypothetical protein
MYFLKMQCYPSKTYEEGRVTYLFFFQALEVYIPSIIGPLQWKNSGNCQVDIGKL